MPSFDGSNDAPPLPPESDIKSDYVVTSPGGQAGEVIERVVLEGGTASPVRWVDLFGGIGTVTGAEADELRELGYVLTVPDDGEPEVVPTEPQAVQTSEESE
jgi:hypothetical protein